MIIQGRNQYPKKKHYDEFNIKKTDGDELFSDLRCVFQVEEKKINSS